MTIFNKHISLLKLRSSLAIFILAIFLWPNVAASKITAQSENGFAVFHVADVAAEPDEIWSKLILPNNWWSGDHSFSGDADNFYLEPKINGCFCELLIDKDAEVKKETGVVEHLRIIHIKDYEVLRMTGALGPLQSEAVNGTFTIAIKPNGDGTSKISFLYVVGGYMRFEVSKIAPSIDKVVGDQFVNLVKLIGPASKTDDIDPINIDKSDALIVDKDIIKLSSDDKEADEKEADEKETDGEDKKDDADEVRRER